MAEQNVRERIVAAFTRLVLGRRRGAPKIAEVVAEAGVARSTVYEHFDGRDGILIEALKAPLGTVADAITGRANAAALAPVLAHFRDRRSEAAAIFSGPLHGRIAKSLAALIAERDPQLAEADRALLAPGGALAAIRLWLDGDLGASPEAMAAQIVAMGRK